MTKSSTYSPKFNMYFRSSTNNHSKSTELVISTNTTKKYWRKSQWSWILFGNIIIWRENWLKPIESIGLRDGEYLLNITNWKVLNVEHFQNKLKQLTIEDKEQNKQSRLNLPSRCVQQSNCDTRIRIGHCATSKYAIYLNN